MQNDRMTKNIFIIACILFSINVFAGESMKTIVIRLKPGQELKKELDNVVEKNNIQAGSIVQAVGSLKEASVRFAAQPNATKLTGPFEIVSLVGTLGKSGSHVHIALADGTGKTIGGHLMEGNKIYTTAEITIMIHEDIVFKREQDATSGYKELVVESKK